MDALKVATDTSSVLTNNLNYFKSAAVYLLTLDPPSCLGSLNGIHTFFKMCKRRLYKLIFQILRSKFAVMKNISE